MGRCVPSHPTRGSGERRKLPQRDESPARNAFWSILKATKRSLLQLYAMIWIRQTCFTSHLGARPRFGVISNCPNVETPMYFPLHPFSGFCLKATDGQILTKRCFQCRVVYSNLLELLRRTQVGFQTRLQRRRSQTEKHTSQTELEAVLSCLRD